jgi:RHS repeat-associated protein
MRLYQVASGGTTQRFAYDGVDRITEFDGSNVVQRRYVFGPGADAPIIWYEGTDTSVRKFLSSDERGSIISVTDNAGALLGINKYDEYGNPQNDYAAAFGYTGQAWLPSLGIWYYKARAYDPELGRFLQTDPAGGSNLYAYVGNDPIGSSDPSGMISRHILAGDDVPRYDDGHSWDPVIGAHSYADLGPVNYVSGRLDEIGIERENREFKLLWQQLGLDGPPSAILVCVKYCNATTPESSDDEIVVQAGPQYKWVQLPSIPFDRIQFAQIGGRDNNCKEAAYLCLQINQSGEYYHNHCMDLERVCKSRSLMMSRVANDEKTKEVTYCVGLVCVTIYQGGIVGAPFVKVPQR